MRLTEKQVAIVSGIIAGMVYGFCKAIRENKKRKLDREAEEATKELIDNLFESDRKETEEAFSKITKEFEEESTKIVEEFKERSAQIVQGT